MMFFCVTYLRLFEHLCIPLCRQSIDLPTKPPSQTPFPNLQTKPAPSNVYLLNPSVMSKRLLLLGCLLNSLLYAQPATIAGKFPYQRDVSYTAMMVSNQITFIEEWGKVAGTSDTSGD